MELLESKSQAARSKADRNNESEVIINDPALEASYRTLDRVIDNIAGADNKALIALTFQGAIVAGLILVADSLHQVMARDVDAWSIAILVFLSAFFACLCLSSLKLFSTISPRIAPPHSSEHVSELFYFGGIAGMKRDVFAARMRELDVADIHEAVVTITHVNASIALAKYKNLRTAFQGLGLQVILYVIVVVLSVLPGHA